MTSLIEDMVTAIVRPPRAKYTATDLGPSRLRCRGVEYKREDFDVTNHRGEKLKSSLWITTHHSSAKPEFCIIYLHPNSGSRVDVVRTKIMAVAAQAQCSVCSFDFSGCGLSDGEYISLGVREKEDVCLVMVELMNRGFNRFLLWGRSMGAATSVMFYGAYKDLLKGTIAAMLLDSPFTSFKGLADEYTKSKIQIPQLLLSPALHYIKRVVDQKYQFDLMQMSPISAASDVDVFTMVLSGQEDKIVPPHLSLELYAHLTGPKIRVFFDGGHNSHRPPEIFDAIQQVVSGAVSETSDLDLLSSLVANLESVVQPSHRRTVSAGPSLQGGGAVTSVNLTAIKSEAAPGVSRSSRSETNSPSSRPKLTPEEQQEEAEKIAQEAQAAMSNLLKVKSLNSLTQSDIAQAFGNQYKLSVE